MLQRKLRTQSAYKEITVRYKFLAVFLPCTLVLGTCTTVTLVYRDNGTRGGPCAEDGLDDVAQKFYDTQIQGRTQDPVALRLYLSSGLVQLLSDARQDPANSKLLQTNPFSSNSAPVGSVVVASASTIPNRDARNIPSCVELKQGTQSWKDEVLMIQEDQCWAVDDVRYLGNSSHAPVGMLQQSLEKR